MTAPGLPGRVPLTGTDWFLLAFDRAMRSGPGAAGVCRLVVELEGGVDVAAVRAALEADPAWAWVRSLRLHVAPTRVPGWRASGPRDASLGVVDVDALPAPTALPVLPDPTGDPGGEDGGALVRLDVVRAPDRGLLVLSWHHALMDARGAETLLRRLGGDPEVADVPLAHDPDAGAAPWKERLLRARDARDFLFDVSAGRVGQVTTEPAPGAAPRFRALLLDEAETAVVDRRAGEAGAHVVRSAFALAAVARAVRALRATRGLPACDLLVPVPQDQRRRGAVGPVVGNWIGTFFYRLADADLVDARTAVAAITGQLRAMMRDGWQHAYTELLSLCRVIPLGPYWRVVAGPTDGVVATFGFSDTGESLGRLATAFGRRVVAALHLPANLHPPGFTVITSRVRGRLQVSVGWLDGTLTDDEITAFERALRAELLG
jgi:hypothetical protein